MRWFGIDRSAKQKGIWENDIREIGYKYQMTDIGASIAIASLTHFDELLKHRRRLFSIYSEGIKDVSGIKSIGDGFTDREHAAWLYTVAAEKRWDLQTKLREHHIESNQVHFRNDRYNVFGTGKLELPNMNYLEDRYLVLPLHNKMTEEDAQRVVQVIKSGW
jgi:perosamine synthetase